MTKRPWWIRATNTVGEVALIYAGLVLAAATLFALLEQRTLGDALWWAIVTATTTGYGDIAPATLGGRIVAGVLMHVSLFAIGPLLIVHVLRGATEDPHQFTDAEQRELLDGMREIRARLERGEG